ncbi:hypothetical protein CC2G_003542 [Coprinopsis cinerea AmutBmut pab1-1]|nr:hypothetical protein CC2G_003542 [Coprinopsis cinerea AmutBmut pab1-1]
MRSGAPIGDALGVNIDACFMKGTGAHCSFLSPLLSPHLVFSANDNEQAQPLLWHGKIVINHKSGLRDILFEGPT